MMFSNELDDEQGGKHTYLDDKVKSSFRWALAANRTVHKEEDVARTTFHFQRCRM